MKKLNLLLFASLFVAALTLCACSSSDSSGDGGSSGPNPPSPNPPSPNVKAKLTGAVYWEYGDPASYITVTSGTTTTQTNDQGVFYLTDVAVNNGRAVVTFTNGSYSVTRSAELKDGDFWEVVISNTNYSSFNATSGGTTQYNGMKVEIPNNAVVDANGNAYTGSVSTQISYLDPASENFAAAMPGGDLMASGYGSVDASNPNPQLVSYGMVRFEMTGDGQKLQLKEGSEATITFPATDVEKPSDDSTIPIWSFNEETGLWVYEGEATKQPDGSYVGKVKHFSWYNLDYPSTRATCKVTVKDSKGTLIKNQRVVVGQTQAYTDENGVATCYIPLNIKFDVLVRSADYANYSPEVSVNNVMATTAGETKSVTLTLPTTGHLSGTITSNGEPVQAGVTLVYGDGASKAMVSGTDGKFFITQRIGYIGAATLKVIAGNGTEYQKNITLTGNDQTINFEIAPAATETGTLVFTATADGAKTNFTVSDIPVYSMGGIITLDGTASIYQSYGHGSDSNSQVYMSKNDDGTYYVNVSPSDGSVYVRAEKATVTMKKENGKYTISINADEATLMDHSKHQEGGGHPQTAGKLSGSYRMSELCNATSTNASTNPATWVPKLSGKTAKYGITLDDNAKLGAGWMLFYNSGETSTDYTNFVNSLKAEWGQPYQGDESGNFDWVVKYVFIKDNRMVQVIWINDGDYYQNAPTADNMFLDYGHEGKIIIRAYSNVQIPYTEILNVNR